MLRAITVATIFITFFAGLSTAADRRKLDFFCVNYAVIEEAAEAAQVNDMAAIARLMSRPLATGCRRFSKLWGSPIFADVERITLVPETDYAIGVAHLSNDWVVFVLIKENLL